jgi:hypothetical protein
VIPEDPVLMGQVCREKAQALNIQNTVVQENDFKTTQLYSLTVLKIRSLK